MSHLFPDGTFGFSDRLLTYKKHIFGCIIKAERVMITTKTVYILAYTSLEGVVISTLCSSPS